MEKIKYKGFEIEIDQDLDAQNPFTEWDGCMPMCTSSGEDYSNGDINNFLRSILTDGQMRYHKKTLMNMMDLDECSLDELSDYLYDFIGESIDNKAAFCSMFNIKYAFQTSQGYSQGDWRELFVCWTPEFEKVSGVKYKDVTIESMLSDCELWGFWAWGEVYGYNIEDAGSCWGFYGDDFDKSGLLEAAKNDIDCHIAWALKKRLEQVKIWIKNRVPFGYRKF